MEIGKNTGVHIEYLGRSGFLIECKEGRRIAIDPYGISGKVGSVDIVLLTHGHRDSCSIKDVEKLVDKNKGALVICTADCQSKVLKMDGLRMEIVEVGDKMELVGGNIRIEAVPAYNKYKDYHPKSEGWVGYLIKIGSVVVYHAGDTDFIPEMQKLSGYGKHGNEFVALLPIGGKTVMNIEQAAEAASFISPDLVIPMNYTPEDAGKFLERCKELNINARVLEKI
jgi:L-ascorbate metabolism protein UlaG (beta-lactamase superfamily)